MGPQIFPTNCGTFPARFGSKLVSIFAPQFGSKANIFNILTDFKPEEKRRPFPFKHVIPAGFEPVFQSLGLKYRS
jgi:hypothetical protein